LAFVRLSSDGKVASADSGLVSEVYGADNREYGIFEVEQIWERLFEPPEPVGVAGSGGDHRN
jgi:hypothetical protein